MILSERLDVMAELGVLSGFRAVSGEGGDHPLPHMPA